MVRDNTHRSRDAAQVIDFRVDIPGLNALFADIVCQATGCCNEHVICDCLGLDHDRPKTNTREDEHVIGLTRDQLLSFILHWVKRRTCERQIPESDRQESTAVGRPGVS